MASSLRPQKTAMLVAQNIVANIKRRGLSAGDRLAPERLMLDEYQVGRGTLREALRFLEFLGVIALKPGPGGGPIVRQPDASSLTIALSLLLQFEQAPYRAVSEARQGLEPMMAELAATRMSATDIASLGQSVEMMEEGLDDQQAFLQANQEFHTLIAHGCGNELFALLVDSMIGILDGGAIGIDYPPPRRQAVLVAHTRIFEAVASRDTDLSRETMSAHIDEYARYAERKYPELMATPILWTGSQ